jgi:hypothetical protein
VLLEEKPSINERLVETQKRIVRAILRSHRLLTAYIYYMFSIIYLWMGWVLLFILWMQLPPSIGPIAVLLIAIPVVMTPFLYTRFRMSYGYLINAKNTLVAISRAESTHQISSSISSYITLLFQIIKPTKERPDEESRARAQINLRQLRIQSGSSLVLQLFMQYFVLTDFLIPKISSLFASGGIIAVLLNPVIMVLGLLLAITITGILLFFLWEIQVRRWMRTYEDFLSWGEDIERTVSTQSDQGKGGTMV